MAKAVFRFYEELNDFLPPDRRKTDFTYEFNGSPGIKDAVEALGVPHTEADLILVNGDPVDFSYRLEEGDRVSVYPVFESFDISGTSLNRPRPLREPRFILDVHLGTLARKLRLLGFDTLYRTDYDDEEIADAASREGRIVLTRDTGLLKRKAVSRGYWLRNTDPDLQIEEIVRRFQLENLIRPFERCPTCNGSIREVPKEEIAHLLEPKTRKYYTRFFRCTECGQIYWRGSHYSRILEQIDRLKNRDKGA
ncbi:MAG: Mut7-C RNAse domain-containing protein [Spirochaetia bacterium]